MYPHLPFQDHPKFTNIGIFGLKIYNLANLICNSKTIHLPWRCGTAVKTTPAEIGTQGSSD
jgi:hypothetical protein